MALKREWTPEMDDLLRQNYVWGAREKCATLLGCSLSSLSIRVKHLGIKVVRPKERIVVDEAAILDLYSKSTSIRAVARRLGYDQGIIKRTLKKHNIMPGEGWTLVERYKKQIIADYQSNTMTNAKIGEKYGVKRHTIKVACKRWGISNPNRNKQLRANKAWKIPSGKSFYDKWLALYGEEEAKKRRLSWIANMTAGRRRGKNHPFYGKSPPKKTNGRGWSGWYKTEHFRSMKELTFILRMEDAGVSFESGEIPEYTIEYQIEGRDHTYHPDFVTESTVYEIKPIEEHENTRVLAKKAAAEAFCSTIGKQYLLIDIEADVPRIHTAYKAGFVRFESDYEERFLKKVRFL